MKTKLILLSMIGFLAIFLTGCGDTTPADTVYKWKQAILDDDFNSANSLTFGAGKSFGNKMLIEMLKDAKKLKGEKVDNSNQLMKIGYSTYIEFRDFTITKEEIKDDKATLYTDSKSKGFEKLDLVKVDGKWLIDMD